MSGNSHDAHGDLSEGRQGKSDGDGRKGRKSRGNTWKWGLIGAYAVVVICMMILDFEPGKEMAKNLYSFAREMVFILPAAFILIGLFDVWVPRRIIERHRIGRWGSV